MTVTVQLCVFLSMLLLHRQIVWDCHIEKLLAKIHPQAMTEPSP